MKPRHLGRAAALALAVSPVVVLAAPSQAATMSFSDLDASTPGHLTGVVTTDAPYVALTTRDTSGRVLSKVAATAVDQAGQVTFDAPTWGGDQFRVFAYPCTDATACSSTAGATSDWLTTTQLAPDVVWPEDTTIGPQDSYPVTVTDAAGAGGALRLYYGSSRKLVAGAGETTDLDFGAASWTGPVKVMRCATTDSASPCTQVAKGPAITVVTALFAKTPAVTVLPAQPSDPAAPDVKVSTVLEKDPFAGAGYQLTWWLTDPSDQTVPGHGGSLAYDPADPTFKADLGDLASGTYRVHETISHDDADFGHVEASVYRGFTIDRTPPALTSHNITGHVVAPAMDGYLDSVLVSARTAERTSMRLSALDASGHEVWHGRPTTFTTGHHDGFTGRTRTGHLSPGTYTVRASLSDKAGNAAVWDTTVKVVSDHLVDRDKTFTVSASGSLVDAWAGSCSTVRKPALGGPKGSLGLYSNTKCDGGDTWKKTGVATVHAFRLPEAYSVHKIQISGNGGSSSRVRGSRAYLELWDNAAKTWKADYLMLSGSGWHSMPGTTATQRYVDSHRWVAWRAVTGYGAWYDVNAFRVRVVYQELVTGRPTTGRPVRSSPSATLVRHAGDRLAG